MRSSAVLLLSVLVISGDAVAQGTYTTRCGVWTLKCEKSARDDTRSCSVMHTTQEKTGSAILIHHIDRWTGFWTTSSCMIGWMRLDNGTALDAYGINRFSNACAFGIGGADSAGIANRIGTATKVKYAATDRAGEHVSAEISTAGFNDCVAKGREWESRKR